MVSSCTKAYGCKTGVVDGWWLMVVGGGGEPEVTSRKQGDKFRDKEKNTHEKTEPTRPYAAACVDTAAQCPYARKGAQPTKGSANNRPVKNTVIFGHMLHCQLDT